MISHRCVSAVIGCLALCNPLCAADDSKKVDLSYLLRNFSFATAIAPADSTQNPDNLLGLPSFQLENEARLDLFLDYGPLNLMAKPRINVRWQRWSEGTLTGQADSDLDLFLNEWRVNVTPDERLFLSYGRENLQWGPSALMSPSNPFFQDNGQRTPNRELPGTDVAQVMWIPNAKWSWSAIANLFEGRRFGKDRIGVDVEFLRTYAFKGDFTDYRKYFSFVASYQETGLNRRGEGLRVGGYTGWTVSDALLLHAEASGSFRNDSLYPNVDETSPFGLSIGPVDAEGDGFGGILLAGGSYTFEIGPTLLIEYLFDSRGYHDAEAERYFTLRDLASEGLSEPPPTSNTSLLALLGTLNPRQRNLRRNYFMFQYTQPQIRNVLDIVFRYTLNADDASSQLLSILRYGAGDHVHILLTGGQNFGLIDSEFRSLVDYAYTFGAEITF